MIAAGEARHADRAPDSVSTDLHQTMPVVFVGYDRSQRPRLNTVTRWKGRSAVEKVTATRSSSGPATLGDLLKRGHNNRAVDQRFGPEHAGLARALVVLCSPEEIEGGGDTADAITRTRVTHNAAGIQRTVGLCHLVSGLPVGGDKRRRS